MSNPPDTDEFLMQSFAGGDQAAFRVLFHRHAQATLSFLVASTSNREAAEDLLQETFSRVCRHREDWSNGLRGGEGDSFRAWLFAIARNLSRDAGRRATVRKRVADEGPDAMLGMGQPEAGPDVAAEREDLARRLVAALSKLPEAQREAFILVRLQELSYEEVAAACATTVAAAKMRVARATAALAGVLGEPATPEVPKS